MQNSRPIADTLTASRVVLGVSLVWLGIKNGRANLPQAALLLLLAWMTDVFDGPLARRDRRRPVTWVGGHDLEADMTVAAGTWVYVAFSGFLQPAWALGVAIIAAALIWLARSIHVCSAVQATSYAAMIVTCLRIAPIFGWLLIAWLATLVTITWPRFLHKADEFVRGIADLVWR